MPTWITAPGYIANVNLGNTFSVNLNCNASNTATYNIIAGSLPSGVTLALPKQNQFIPSIWGMANSENLPGTYSFTIRATDNNSIADRTFSICVSNVELLDIFPNANLGIFPAGAWMSANIAPIAGLPFTPNISLSSGGLPGNLTIDSSGYISGYINPAVLYDTPAIYPNIEVGKPNISLSMSSNTFSFTAAYGSNLTANFTLTVASSGSYYSPIFLESDEGKYINIGNITGNFLQHQFEAVDYENNTINYQLINGNVFPNSNLSLNANTGWLTGYVDNYYSNASPYEFNVRAYKKVTEPTSGINPYQTILPVYLTVESPYQKNVQWTSPINIGNVTPGVPSTISFKAEILESTTPQIAGGATANATLKVIDATIINGGSNFNIGEWFIVTGGINSSNANIVVTGNTSNGSISSVSISPGVQQYTELPNLSNIIWNNPNGLNAIIDLNFGIDTVNVLSTGEFYDSALVGFGLTGETSPASATVLVYNGGISNIILTNTGSNYLAIPPVIITERSAITPGNPINYSLIDGMIPTGLRVLSNGDLVGSPSFQYFSFNDCTLLNDKTEFDLQFTFTITAIVGSNKSSMVPETDLPGPNNIVNKDFQYLAKTSQTFTLNLVPSPISSYNTSPKTNLSLEFLLNDEDSETLFTPLLDQAIIPNSAIYRQQDFYFGIQNTIRMLIGYGIAAVTPAEIAASLDKYYHRKTFLFTNLKWAQSTTDGYEIIYIQPLDSYTDLAGNSYSGSITTANYETLYPPTIPNMINQLNTTLSGFDENFLPTWMTDTQPNGEILGFVPAIPLVYVNPGQGQKILFYLQQYYDNNRPLNTIFAETDRYVWNYGILQNWNTETNTWSLSEITEFTKVSSIFDMLTELGIILTTEAGINISTEEIDIGDSTTFYNVTFVDTSDKFLHQDEGSIYLKFKNSPLDYRRIVGV